MSTVEMIAEKAKALPEPLQAEALEYVDFLLCRAEAQEEGKQWTKSSAAELAKQYGPGDSIYDSD
jgi:hypothetical protein